MVVTAISQGLRIAQKVYKISQKYKYLDFNKKFIRKYVPPGYRKQAEVISDVLIGGGLLYQVIDLAYNAQKQNGNPKYTQQQTRGGVYSPSRRRKFGQNYYTSTRRRNCKCRRRI